MRLFSFNIQGVAGWRKGLLRLTAGRQPAWIAPLLVLVVAALLLYGGLRMTESAGQAARPAYRAEDVVYGQGLEVGHDMPQMTADLPAETDPGGSSPKAELASSFADLGVVPPDGIATQVFTLANSGSAPLVIEHAYTTCGCTTARISAAEIPPGKVALITLRFDPAYHNLHDVTLRRGLLIETNDPRSPLVEIWIQVRVGH